MSDTAEDRVRAFAAAQDGDGVAMEIGPGARGELHAADLHAVLTELGRLRALLELEGRATEVAWMARERVAVELVEARATIAELRARVEELEANDAPPWLEDLCAALGWQNGNARDAIAAVRRLVLAAEDSSRLAAELRERGEAAERHRKALEAIASQSVWNAVEAARFALEGRR